MNELEKRIQALEHTIICVRESWVELCQERDRLQDENIALRNRISDIDQRGHKLADQSPIQQNSQSGSAGVTSAGRPLEEEIKEYIAEIDQCLEWLNSI